MHGREGNIEQERLGFDAGGLPTNPSHCFLGEQVRDVTLLIEKFFVAMPGRRVGTFLVLVVPRRDTAGQRTVTVTEAKVVWPPGGLRSEVPFSDQRR